MKFVLLSVVCLVGAVMAIPVQQRQKRNILPGDPRYGTDYHHHHHQHESSGAQVPHAVYGPPNHTPGQSINYPSSLTVQPSPTVSVSHFVPTEVSRPSNAYVPEQSSNGHYQVQPVSETAQVVASHNNGYVTPASGEHSSESAVVVEASQPAQLVGNYLPPSSQATEQHQVHRPVDSYGAPIHKHGETVHQHVQTVQTSQPATHHQVVEIQPAVQREVIYQSQPITYTSQPSGFESFQSFSGHSHGDQGAHSHSSGSVVNAGFSSEHNQATNVFEHTFTTSAVNEPQTYHVQITKQGPAHQGHVHQTTQVHQAPQVHQTTQVHQAPHVHQATHFHQTPAVQHVPAVHHAPAVQHTPAVQHVPAVHHAPAVQHVPAVHHAPAVQYVPAAHHAPTVYQASYVHQVPQVHQETYVHQKTQAPHVHHASTHDQHAVHVKNVDYHPVYQDDFAAPENHAVHYSSSHEETVKVDSAESKHLTATASKDLTQLTGSNGGYVY